LVKNVGEMAIMQEAAEEALNEEYGNILMENQIKAIGRPQITITKLAPGNPMGFKIKTAVLPEFNLPDYKKLAKEEMSKPADKVEVTDQEIEDLIMQLRKTVAHQGHEHKPGEEHHEIPESELPEFSDEFVKKLGEFKDVADFKEKIRGNMQKEKELTAKDKKRVELMENLLKNTEIKLPEVIVQSELDKLVAQFQDDITRAGMKYDEYLKHIKKTEEDLRKEWRETAEKKGKMQLILSRIAKEENLFPNEDEIKKEVDRIIEHNKGADRFRARMFVETFLTNEKVLSFLESQK
jgi:FKBP-type peptidyl-prolyl cis-trans isomerase (trigger factor)